MNILLITLDQWRADHVGPRHTPHLDALSKEATRFDRHFSQAYPCGPARASLLTGLYPHKHRVVNNGVPLDARHPTLFGELRKAGYRPTLFGYTDVTLDPRGKAEADPDNGDEENVCTGLSVDTLLTERAGPWLADLTAKGHAAIDPAGGRLGVIRRNRFDAPASFDAADSEAAFLTNRFLGWLSVVGETQFCAHVSFIAPHPPFVAPAPFHQMVSPDDVDMPLRGATPDVEANQHPLMRALLASVSTSDFAPGSSGLSQEQDLATIRQVRAIYAGMVRQADEQLGRIFQALRDSGRWDDTVVIVTADHGEQLFDHWLLGKTGYFDQSAHIPLIVRDPRAASDGGRGRRINAFTESIDVMPTLLALAGLDMPANLDGHSLLPWCAGERPADWRDAAHWSFDFRDIATQAMERRFGLRSDWCHLQVLRTDSMKYVHFAGMPPVLFDLEDDPQERINRASDAGARHLRTEGLDRMMTWRQQHEERGLTDYLARNGKLYRRQEGARGRR